MLPFKVPDLFAGFAEGKGLAKASPSELTIEFMIKDNVVNMFKSGLKEVRIPQGEIEFVRHKEGWFHDKIRIRVKSMKWLADLPGCDDAELTLQVARGDRPQAADLVKILSSTADSGPSA
jgi:hypothetical protein